MILLGGHSCFFRSSDKISIPEEAGSVVKLAKEDLASRRGIDKDEIAVVDIESVDWPDAGLGCPEPGKVYAQVITPGYKIFFSCEKEIYEYHSDNENRVVYCGSKSS